MRVYRTNQVAALTIVAGGAIAALLTLSPLVWQSPADEVSAPDPVDTPSMTSEARPDAVDRAERILRDRIDEFGVEEPLVQQARGFDLQQNYPNPFNPETRIPFDLLEGLFSDGGTAVVSVRIYNVLQQFVAAPLALGHPSGQTPLIDLEYLMPGRYEAYWDGRDQSGREVASGIYFLQLTVNGVREVKRMYVAK